MVLALVYHIQPKNGKFFVQIGGFGAGQAGGSRQTDAVGGVRARWHVLPYSSLAGTRQGRPVPNSSAMSRPSA